MSVVASPPRTIEVELAGYLRLLVKADRFDPADWPAGYERGAELLREIRRIEQDCVREHGRWHPDLLPPGGEDRYEELIYALDDLIDPFDPNEPVYTHDEVFGDLLDGESASNGAR